MEDITQSLSFKFWIENRYAIIGKSFVNWTGLGLSTGNTNAIVENTIENYCKFFLKI